MIWGELTAGWRAALTEAWLGYCRGANPVGASVVDGSGQVVASGQNRTRDVSAPPGQICSNSLAHAEINALLQINNQVHVDLTGWQLMATLEPCAQCIGAFYLSGIRRLEYAAREPGGGSTEIIGSTAYLSKKDVQISGPNALLEAVHIVLRYDWAAQLEIASVIRKERKLCEAASAHGERLSSDGILRTWRDSGAEMDRVFDGIVEEFRRHGTLSQLSCD